MPFLALNNVFKTCFSHSPPFFFASWHSIFFYFRGFLGLPSKMYRDDPARLWKNKTYYFRSFWMGYFFRCVLLYGERRDRKSIRIFYFSSSKAWLTLSVLMIQPRTIVPRRIGQQVNLPEFILLRQSCNRQLTEKKYINF